MKEDMIYITKNQGPNRAERNAKKAQHRKIQKQYNKRFKKDNDWGQLEELYQKNNDMFIPIKKITTTISQVEPERYLNQDEREVLIQNIKLLSKDIKAYKKELDQIHDVHKGRKGPCHIEDFGLLMEIGETYMKYSENYQAIILPTYEHIGDLLRIAEDRKLIEENPELVKERIEFREKQRQEALKQHQEQIESNDSETINETNGDLKDE